MRSHLWRFTEWYQWNGSALRPVVPAAAVEAPCELYDHRDDTTLWDPDAAEYENVAEWPVFGTIVSALREVLRAHVQAQGR